MGGEGDRTEAPGRHVSMPQTGRMYPWEKVRSLTVYQVKSVCGTKTKNVSRHTLNQLRMLMDWQLRQLGYDPMSVTIACRKLDGE